jgi:hypothetical protein
MMEYSTGRGRRSMPPGYTGPLMQVVPLTSASGPGEYEIMYRPDVHPHHEDKKAPYDNARAAELPHDDFPNYKPGPLRWPLLCAMIMALLGLIAGTEWACRTLPVEDRQRPLPTTAMPATPTALSRTTAPPVLLHRGPQGEGQATATTTPDAVSRSNIYWNSTDPNYSCETGHHHTRWRWY